MKEKQNEWVSIADLMAGTLPKLHERRRMAEELLAGWRQRGPGLAPHEDRPPQLLLQQPDTSADGCLADM